MGLFDWFSDLTSFSGDAWPAQQGCDFANDFAVNPANGLPMVDGIGSVDVAGNPFGSDFSCETSWSSGASSTGFGDDW